MKRRRITTILLVILLIIGFGMVAYPWVSNGLFASSQAYIIEDYRDAVETMDTEEIEEAKEEALEYDRTEISSGTGDPFTEADANIDSGNYANILNVGDVMGYLDIPKLHVTLPIYHGTGELAMREGVGHMEGTSMPVGGSSTHCVLASHSGLTDAKLFTDLDKMKIGDKFYLTVLDEKLTYQVDQINVVLPNDTSKLQVKQGEDYVTLLTCTPTGMNTHRLLVRGMRIPNEEEEVVAQKPISDLTILGIIWWMLPLMAAGLILFCVCYCRKRHKR